MQRGAFQQTTHLVATWRSASSPTTNRTDFIASAPGPAVPSPTPNPATDALREGRASKEAGGSSFLLLLALLLPLAPPPPASSASWLHPSVASRSSLAMRTYALELRLRHAACSRLAATWARSLAATLLLALARPLSLTATRRLHARCTARQPRRRLVSWEARHARTRHWIVVAAHALCISWTWVRRPRCGRWKRWLARAAAERQQRMARA